MDQINGKTDDEVANRIKLFESNIRAMKNEEKRLANEISTLTLLPFFTR